MKVCGRCRLHAEIARIILEHAVVAAQTGMV
jgi:hypothetical protein